MPKEDPYQGHEILPTGTRVVLIRDIDHEDGSIHSGSPGRVELAHHPEYTVSTPAGRRFEVQREDLRILKRAVADELASRAAGYDELEPNIVLSVVVGSTAWNLNHASSDLDLKGAFLWPFSMHASLFEGPEEIRASTHDAQYLEVGKFVRLGLDADPNVLETLFAPEVVRCNEIGFMLRDARRVFLSRRIYRAFGRYALGQLDKLRTAASWARHENAILQHLRTHPEHDARTTAEALEQAFGSRQTAAGGLRRLARSLYDRNLIPHSGFDALAPYAAATPPSDPDAPVLGQKNAYNLIRLLHSGLHWLRHGEPLIRIEAGRPDALRETLMAIKSQQVPLFDILEMAQQLALELEDAHATSPLPERPDIEAADALLIRCRRWAADRA